MKFCVLLFTYKHTRHINTANDCQVQQQQHLPPPPFPSPPSLPHCCAEFSHENKHELLLAVAKMSALRFRPGRTWLKREAGWGAGRMWQDVALLPHFNNASKWKWLSTRDLTSALWHDKDRWWHVRCVERPPPPPPPLPPLPSWHWGICAKCQVPSARDLWVYAVIIDLEQEGEW